MININMCTYIYIYMISNYLPFTVYLVSKIHASPSSFIQTTTGVRATGVSEPWQPWASSVILKSWGILGIQKLKNQWLEPEKYLVVWVDRCLWCFFFSVCGAHFQIPAVSFRGCTFCFFFLEDWITHCKQIPDPPMSPKIPASCQDVLARVRAAVPLLPASHKLKFHQKSIFTRLTVHIQSDLVAF